MCAGVEGVVIPNNHVTGLHYYHDFVTFFERFVGGGDEGLIDDDRVFVLCKRQADAGIYCNMRQSL
jgi:hypothetical protein